MDTTTRQFQIPLDRLPAFEKRAAQLSRRAVKLGCPAITWEIVGDAQQRITHPDRAPRIVDIAVVDVTGPAPVIPGWTFAGTIQHLDEGVNLLRTFGASDVPARFRDCAPACEHCRKSRRRNDTYIVLSDAGEYKQIGRNCVADFCGHPSAQDIAAACEWIADLDDEAGSYGDEGDEEGGCSRGPSAWELRYFLGHCYDLMSVEGYVSRKASDSSIGRLSTAQAALMLISPGKGKTWVPPTHAAMVKADAAIEWAREWVDASDFAHNCRTVARVGKAEWRTAGIAAAICIAYEREMGRAAEARAAATESTHFGTVGKRATFTLTVRRAHSYESTYGVKTVVSFVDDDGNRAVWFASGVPDLSTGHRYTVKATVKEHGRDERADTPVDQTVLQRVTVEHDHGNPRAIPLPAMESTACPA